VPPRHGGLLQIASTALLTAVPLMHRMHSHCVCLRRASTLTPKVNQLLFEKYPWLAIRMPAVITHRAAVSMEVMDDIARAARTS
jgi:hypothetical protein